MNTINTDENSRPFGFWLKAVDRLMAAEFASAFEAEGITRREWRLLNVVDGTVPAGHTKSDRTSPTQKLPAHKLARLIELGWVTDADGTWTLTGEGRTAKERLGGIVDGIRAKVTDAVPAEDLATTMSTLEQLARAFGWDESMRLPRGRGRHGFGPGGFGRGRGHGFGPRGLGGRGFGPHRFDHEDRDDHDAPDLDAREHCQHGEHPFAHDANRGHRGGPRSHEARGHEGHGLEGHGHRGRGRAHVARFVQRSYERGFDAGFTRGRDAQ